MFILIKTQCIDYCFKKSALNFIDYLSSCNNREQISLTKYDVQTVRYAYAYVCSATSNW